MYALVSTIFPSAVLVCGVYDNNAMMMMRVQSSSLPAGDDQSVLMMVCVNKRAPPCGTSRRQGTSETIRKDITNQTVDAVLLLAPTADGQQCENGM